MEVVQIFILFSFIYASVNSQTAHEKKAFDEWKRDFHKSYKTPEAENEALQNFVINLEFVEIHNAKFKKGLVSSEVGLW